MTYALSFAMGAAGFVMGMVIIALGAVVYYRYRSGGSDRQIQIFFSTVAVAASLAGITVSISLGALLASLEVNWLALGLGISSGLILGATVFSFARWGLLKLPKERWIDIKLR